MVRMTGPLFTGRESFYLRAAQESILPPLDYSLLNVMMHVGPVISGTVDDWLPLSMTPTTSIRMEKFCGPILRKLRTRAIIGKGTMGEQTMTAMVDVGAVHLCGLGINPTALAKQVQKVVEVHYLDEIGPTEATWVLDVADFGPFVVDMDSRGSNLFSALSERSLERLQAIYRKHGIPPDYEYTPI
jgi:tartrate/fumarate subfamily iron-sulfur-dependent hydro-lyase beta chain